MKLRQHFCEFSRHVLFWTARTFSDIFLDGVNATRNFERNLFYAANIRGNNLLQLFILSKRFGWICGSVLLYVKLPWNFPPLHKQGLHPAEILKALKCDGLLGFTTRIIWKLHFTSFMVNLPRSGRPQKLSMEANSVCRNCAK